MKDKKKYIAPLLTVVTFRMEHGYAGSLTLFTAMDIEEQQMEDYQVGNNWVSGSNSFWD